MDGTCIDRFVLETKTDAKKVTKTKTKNAWVVISSSLGTGLSRLF
ncbi:hypothetical protein PALA104618_02990 [Paenibacillus larvae]